MSPAPASPARGPVLVRAEFRGHDLGVARARYEKDYNGAGFRVERTEQDFRFRYSSTGDRDVTLRSSMYLASVTGVIEPLGEYVVSWLNSGRGTMDVGQDPVSLPLGLPAVFPTGRSFAFDFADFRQNLIHLRSGYLEQVAAERIGGTPAPLLFDHTDVPAPDAVQRWNAAVGNAARHLLGTEPVPAVLRAELNRGLALAVLDTFRHRPVPVDPGLHTIRGARIRLAVEFMQANAHLPITATDIARAAGLSVRGLQQAFRSALDVAPTSYLRSVRLDRTRAELLAGGPHDTTVAEVARVWGFGHMGRFSASYRSRFGEYPRETLLR